MIKNLNEDTALKFKTLSAEEKANRGILARLYGPVADCVNPTRNERRYSAELWEKLFNSPLIKERFNNGGIMGELMHPADRSEIDITKVAVIMPEPPVKDKSGQLVAYLDVLDTPCGKIAYQLAKYGYKFGISSRGEGDLITDFDGNESVDPNTYTLSAFDLVEIPAVENARLTFVESLENKNKKTLKESLQESLNNATDDERRIMNETLESLGINLSEEVEDVDDEEPVEVSDALTADEQKSIDMMKDASLEESAGTVMAATAAAKFVASHWDQILVGLKDLGVTADEIDKDIVNIVKRHKDLKDGVQEDYSPKYATLVHKDGEWLIWGGRGDTISDSEKEEFLQRHPEYDDIKTVENGGDEYKAVYAKTSTDITDESLDIDNGTVEESIAVESNEAIVEQLQNLLKVNATLEQQVIELQEKLSVSYAKEAKIEEETDRYKNTIKSLAESAREAKALQVKVSSLEYKLNESNNVEQALKNQLKEAKGQISENANRASSLRESITKKSSEVSKLNESINSLNESVKSLNEELESTKKSLTEAEERHQKDLKVNKQLKAKFEKETAALNESIAQLQKDKNLQKTEYSQKLEKAKKLIEKYKGATAKAVDKYIELQAVRLGSSVNEVKNRLPESYSFGDIDKVCEDLQSYNLNMSKLPFNTLAKKSINENMKVKGVSSKNESILPVNGFDDDIDEDLLYLAGRK